MSQNSPLIQGEGGSDAKTYDSTSLTTNEDLKCYVPDSEKPTAPYDDKQSTCASSGIAITTGS